MRKYKKHDYERVMSLHQIGYGQNSISKIVGINPSTICSWIYSGSKPYDVWTDEDYLKHSENKRASKMGSLNPAWKGDEAKPQSGRARAEKMYTPPEGYQIHHIDGNPLNNDPANILFVTPKQHMIIDGRMKELQKGLNRKKGKVRK